MSTLSIVIACIATYFVVSVTVILNLVAALRRSARSDVAGIVQLHANAARLRDAREHAEQYRIALVNLVKASDDHLDSLVAIADALDAGKDIGALSARGRAATRDLRYEATRARTTLERLRLAAQGHRTGDRGGRGG